MSETDVLKMKVADLKRELKLRGLSTVGNKVELQERLQTALLDGDFSLEDTAISEELLDEDVLTDEEEKAVLESPQEEKVLLQETEKNEEKQSSSNELKEQPKKVILKRNHSTLSVNSSTTNASVPITPSNSSSSNSGNITLNTGAGNVINSSDGDPSEKILKLHDPIEAGNSDKIEDKTNAESKKIVKLSELSMKERLEMRAKKFGISAAAKDSIGGGGKLSSALDTLVKPEQDVKLIESLKKRAERFGCVLSPKIADIEKQEKLQKRQERFGLTTNNNGTNATATGGVSITNQAAKDLYAEKARLRLERFKAK